MKLYYVYTFIIGLLFLLCLVGKSHSVLAASMDSSICLDKPYGDVNCDEEINDQDFELWKKDFTGETTIKTADLNGDQHVDLVDYDIWRKFISKGSIIPYVHNADRRFAILGTVGITGKQFTDEEFNQLAKNFDFVIMDKFHAGFSIKNQKEAARRLTNLNPHMKVILYFSSKYWFERSNYFKGFDANKWSLRNKNGAIIYFKPTTEKPEGIAITVDLSNSEYRQFALRTILQTLSEAPFNGVFFDAANPIGLGTEIDKWNTLVGKTKVKAWGEGLTDLLLKTKEGVGTNKVLFYNGLTPVRTDRVDRDLANMNYADGALDEQFCLDEKARVRYIAEDMKLMSDLAAQNKIILAKTNYDQTMSSTNISRLGSFCLGAFLMGYQPGHTYFKFGPLYVEGEITSDPKEVGLNLGQPKGTFHLFNQVASREFEHGIVYVNLDTKEAPIKLSQNLTQMQDGKETRTFIKNSTLTLDPQTAVFFLSSDLLEN